jgi:histidinol-phosphate aminotransferase
MKTIDQLVRRNIRELTPYTSAREQFLDNALTLLDANENPWGSIGMADSHQVLNRYPDPYQRQVKEKLTELKNHPVQGIFLGNGSDEIIDLLIRIFCEPQHDEILTTAPTYGMYRVSAAINNVKIREILLDDTFQLDADKILAAAAENTKLLFICSPNNPTGNLMDQGQVLEILDHFEGVVVIDEAYIDFADDPGFIQYCSRYPKLVVLQTFSKAWGMAGVRLGTAYTSEAIVQFLNKIKPPYNVNQLTQKQVLTALEDAHEINLLVAKVKNGREWLSRELSPLENVEKVYPSDANFLLVKMNQARTTYNALVERQIVVRDRSNVTLCEGCLRITIGTEEENQRLIDALRRMES